MDDINIDESRHKPVPTGGQRLANALAAALTATLLLGLLRFLILGGFDLAKLNMIQGFSMGRISGTVTIMCVAFILICAATGWFKGEYAAERLMGFISYWKFW